MGKVYKDQTYLKIKASTGVNITGATQNRIYYIKPGGDTGFLSASVEDAPTGVLYYDVQNADGLIDEAGVWEFWAYIKFSDGRVARGESFKVRIHEDNME